MAHAYANYIGLSHCSIRHIWYRAQQNRSFPHWQRKQKNIYTRTHLRIIITMKSQSRQNMIMSINSRQGNKENG